ncbi:hypothetical protein [uncultured Roseovarius sp.]|uniref:hypothetical protein n=1 Tax=uncultured Roseovarius sp. TaxID=293344 RepID=UPI00261E9F38|nr:hypothetical protein [uncultured Roseovarius sp.]
MSNFRSLAAVSVLAMAAATTVAAQEEGLCEVRDSSDIISVALCPEGLSQEDLGKAGAEICGERLPCGVWFWTNPDDAPAEAPDNHDGLTKEQVTTATAVYVGEDKMLINIEELAK